MWRSLEITVSAEHAEALSDLLIEAGASSVSVSDADAGTEHEDAQYGEPGMAPARAWAMSELNALFPAGTDVQATLEECSASLGLKDIPAARVSEVADEDWVRLTQSQFQPIPISPRLWIVPSWHENPDPTAISIALDPGLAFGTGSHPTTRLCLRWLDRHVQGGETVLDYGCGSGILVIAALKFGARRALGVDIDPQAVAAAGDNAARNGYHVGAAGDAVEFVDTGAHLALTADIVIANILANPLIVLAPVLARHCVAGGALVLSGILAHQAQDVIDAYAEHFALAVGDTDEGWVCVTGMRRAEA